MTTTVGEPEPGVPEPDVQAPLVAVEHLAAAQVEPAEGDDTRQVVYVGGAPEDVASEHPSAAAAELE